MMHDRRVVRGNTYAPIVHSKNTETFKDSSKILKATKGQIQKVN